jgi:hypothetical protein
MFSDLHSVPIRDPVHRKCGVYAIVFAIVFAHLSAAAASGSDGAGYSLPTDEHQPGTR